MHAFLGPCCFCVCLELDDTSYMESVIFLVTSGPYAGKYIAACVEGQCQYWSKFPMEAIHVINLSPFSLP